MAGQAGDRIIFCATDEPTERHVYALDPSDQSIERLTTEPGVHTATVLGDLLAISSETLEDDGLAVRIIGTGATRDVAPLRSLPQPTFAPRATLLTAGERELRTAVILPRDEFARPARCRSSWTPTAARPSGCSAPDGCSRSRNGSPTRDSR